MSLRDRVPVEPLDDERWARLERAVVASVGGAARAARPARPWRAWAFGGAAVAMAAALALVVWRGRTSDGTARAPLAISTDVDGARIDLGDAVVVASPETAFEVTRPGGGVDVALARGKVELEVAPRHGRAPLVVHAGDVDVVVVGTHFSVTRGDDITVEVAHGVVQVERAGVVTRVGAGERWSGPAILLASAAVGVGASAGPGAGATIPAGTAGGGATGGALGPAPNVLGRNHVAAVPGGSASGGGAVSSGGHGSAHAGSAHAAPPPVVVDPIGDLMKAIAAQPLAAATATAGTRDPIAAAEVFQRQVADGKGLSAAQALYALALTQHTALGKDADALRSLDAYVRRFPDGAETEPVLWLRVRILCRHHLDEPCRVAAHTYLPHADGPRGHLAEQIINAH